MLRRDALKTMMSAMVLPLIPEINYVSDKYNMLIADIYNYLINQYYIKYGKYKEQIDDIINYRIKVFEDPFTINSMYNKRHSYYSFVSSELATYGTSFSLSSNKYIASNADYIKIGKEVDKLMSLHHKKSLMVLNAYDYSVMSNYAQKSCKIIESRYV